MKTTRTAWTKTAGRRTMVRKFGAFGFYFRFLQVVHILYGALLLSRLALLFGWSYFIYSVSRYNIVLRALRTCHPFIAGVSDNGKNTLTLLNDDDGMSPEDHAIGMVIPNGFRYPRRQAQLL